jgi:hypothetical protein
VKPLRSGKISTIVKRFGTVHTLTWADSAGKFRTAEKLTPTQYAQMLEAIEKQGGTFVSQAEDERWYTEPVPAGMAQFGAKLWRQTFGSDADPLAFAFAKRRLPGRRVETPYFLRHDLIADRAATLTQDLRGRLDEDDPDSPSVLGFGASFAEHLGHSPRVPATYAIRAWNTQAYIAWLADHDLRQMPIIAAIFHAHGERSPEVQKLVAARLAIG